MEIKLPAGGALSWVGTSRDTTATDRALPLSVIMSGSGVVEVVGAGKTVGRVGETAETNAQDLDQETRRDVMKRMSELVSMLDRDLKFEVHEDSGIVQIQVIDTTDGRIVRKIPADEVLKLVASIREKMSERVDVTA
jgi:uncharacterized FlaG/YvyC family protein